MTGLPRWRRIAAYLIACVVALGLGAAGAGADPSAPVLTVTLGGDGTGAVISDPGTIQCPAAACAATFSPGDSVTLTATPAPRSVFTGFGNACTGQACTVVLSDDATVTADFDLLPTITVPAAGADYAQAAVPAAAFVCAAGDTVCSATVNGQPLAANRALPSTPGSYSFSVIGRAADGASVTQSASYTVSAPPTAAITAPAAGGSYATGNVPAAAFTCTPDPRTTLRSCTAKVDGTTAVQPGEGLPATPGSTHTLTVTATDADGSSSPTASATYTVFPPPACADAGATTNEGVSVPVPVSCSDPHAPALSYTIRTAPRHGSISRPRGVITYTPRARFAGTDTLTYVATSVDGTSDVHTARLVVLAPPTAQIAAPPAAQAYTVGQPVPTRFGCGDDPAGPGLRACTDSAGVSDGTGMLDTATEGPHTYTVTATSLDGQSGRATIGYTVVGKAPEVVIAAPVNNAAYLWTAIPASDFTCIAGVGSTIQSCKATVGGQPISNHQPLPNGFGAHVLTVTATDADGLSATVTVTYTSTVTAALPPVTIRAPSQGASYRLGQAVVARYSCRASTTGPKLKSCVGTVRAGHRIDTSTLGAHTFSVSATNDQGNSTTEIVTFRVVHTTNRFAVVGLRATPSGTARLALRLPGPGSVRVLATAWNAAARASRRHVPYGTASVRARRRGRLSVVVAPSATGRRLLRTRGVRPVIALAVTYIPTGARRRVIHPPPLRVRRSSRPTAHR